MKTFTPPTPIEPTNIVQIENALREANGRAHDHAVKTFDELMGLVAVADMAMERLLPQFMWTGARAIVRADASVPERDDWSARQDSYSYGRPTRMTIITLHCVNRPRCGAWSLGGIRRRAVTWRTRMQCDVTLTDRQEEVAREYFSGLYKTRPYTREEVLNLDPHAQFMPCHRFTDEVESWLVDFTPGWRRVRVEHPQLSEVWAILFRNADDAFSFRMRWREPVKASA
jgi:hypothetical protein